MAIFPYRGWLRNPSPVGRGFKPFFVLPTGDLGLASTLPPVKSVYYRNTTCIKNIKEPYSKNLPHIHRCIPKSRKKSDRKGPQKSEKPVLRAIFRHDARCPRCLWPGEPGCDRQAPAETTSLGLRAAGREEPGHAAGPETVIWGIWPLRIRSSYGKSIIFDV